MSPDEARVLDALTAKPQTLATLADHAGLTSRRSAEEAVHALRLGGHPIVSDTDGVRLSDDPAEVAAGAEALRRRLIAQYATVRALRRTARRMIAALTPSYAVAETPSLWDERLSRSQGGGGSGQLVPR